MALLGLPPLRPNFDAAVRDVNAKDPVLRMQAAERLGDATDDELARAAEALVRMLSDPDPRVRCAALDACGQLGSETLTEGVIDRMEDPDPSVREMSIVALSRIGGDAAKRAVRRALVSDHAETRFQAVQSHMDLSPEDAESLRRLVRDEDPMVRANVAQALGVSSDPVAVELLTLCAEDHNPRVRRRAAIELARLGNASALKDALEALHDNELVFDALSALGTLGRSDAIEPIAERARGFLQPLVIKAAAGGALARLGDPRGVTLLREVLTAWRSDGRSFAAEIVGELQLVELAPELQRLVDRPRGVAFATLARAIGQLLPRAPSLRPTLKALASYDAEAAEIASEALQNTPS